MMTEGGSAEGYIRDDDYRTAEIKICPKCGLRIKEEYRAYFLPKVIITLNSKEDEKTTVHKWQIPL